MDVRTFVSATVTAIAVCTASLAQEPPAAPASGYAWADSCRVCHEAIYDAWEKTKHATALDRLSGSEQDTECVGCHVTGAKSRVMDGRRVVNRGVQCEACHGGAAAHIANPAAPSAGFVRTPDESRCTVCHNSKSPRFKGFFYAAMSHLSHKVQ